jgi:phosphatidylglycerol---prolipoprotein diacylglyceryl transferase
MIHLVFDVLAAICSFSVSALVYWWRLETAGDRVVAAGPGYPLALFCGAIAGAYGAGTANLWLSGLPGIGRSIVGALAGGITAIEIYKWRKGLRGSTGLVFVPAFAMSIMVGRIGCFMAGLEDYTYGTPTSILWGVDFGDGIRRHPVQIYESLAMAAFLVAALGLLARRQPFFMRNGFYLLVFWYAGQRFVWEFLKPYGGLIGPVNIFHVICAGLMVYASWMIGNDLKLSQRRT